MEIESVACKARNDYESKVVLLEVILGIPMKLKDVRVPEALTKCFQ